MILVIAFCQKDKATTLRLANWIAELGGTSRHDLLLGFHEDTTPEPIHEILKPHFNHVGGFKISDSETSYPTIANIMWHECVKTVADQFNVPWFWMEPDAVPLVPEWLDKIEDEYLAAKKPFMLDRVVTPTRSHNSGVGVYPGRVRDFTQKLWQLGMGIPWDVFLAEDITPFTHHTKLIHDKFYRVWEDPNSGPPVFPDAESLSIIEPEAVLFHRNKDGSLIERLRESRGGVTVTRPVLIGGENAGVNPAPATPSPTLSEVIERLERLERWMDAKKREHTAMEPLTEPSPAQCKNVRLDAALNRIAPRFAKKPDTRTPEQIQSAKDRMAKARAGRKK